MGRHAGRTRFVPKVFDGRNKVFFFVAYEGVRNTLPRPSAATVPTAAERTGDLSALLAIGPQYTVYDPASGVAVGARIQRTPFSGNIIPASRINPISKNLMQFLPLPNNFTLPDGTNDYLSNEAELDTFWSGLTRVDFNFSARNKFYVNLRHNHRVEAGPDLYHNIGTNYFAPRINTGGMVEDVMVLSATTTVFDIRANYTRYSSPAIAGSDGYDITQLGFPASLKGLTGAQKLPSIGFSDITGGIGGIADGNSDNETYQIFSTVTKVRGNQSIKFGTDLRLYRNAAASYGNSTGAYTFGTNWTNGPLDNSVSAPQGQDWAGFLLGLPTAGSLDLNGSDIYQAGYYSLFVQDDFRVRPDLTLNLGVRYERDLPTTERFNRTVNGFDSTAPSPVSAAALAAYAQNPIAQIPASQFRVNGGLLFAGPGDRSVYNTTDHNFSPRVGLAWKPKILGEKTVIRGGFGMYYFPVGATGIYQTGFSNTTSMVVTNNGYLTPAATLSNPFPSGVQYPVGSSQGLATYMGKAVTFYNPNPLNPYSLRWTANVQHALPGRITMQLGYEGNHAVHLTDSATLDYTPAQFLSTSPFRNQAVINTLSANVANPFANLLPGTTINGSTIPLSSLLMAYPQFTSVTEAGLNEANSYYEDGSVRLEKRFSGGLTLQAHYDLSKLLGRFSRLNSSDVQLTKQVAAEDRPQRLVILGSYELPFGRGKRYLSQVPAVLNAATGGWIVNVVHAQQVGAALNWGNVLYFGGDLDLNNRNVAHAFNTSLFDRVSADQLSDNIRTFPLTFGNLRQDGSDTYDMSGVKQFHIHERLRFEYRCEWFNALNHPNFSAPNLSPTSSAFGTITSISGLNRVIQMSLRLGW